MNLDNTSLGNFDRSSIRMTIGMAILLASQTDAIQRARRTHGTLLSPEGQREGIVLAIFLLTRVFVSTHKRRKKKK